MLKSGALLATAAAMLLACGAADPRTASNMNVEVLQTQKLVLRGTADASLASAVCAAAAPAKPKHLLELKESTAGSLRLRPAMTETGTLVAVLHVTHLDSNRTWCATTTGESNATIEGKFPAGTYSISVAEPRSEQAHRYEVVVEQL